MKCLRFGRAEKEYNQDVRSFGLTLHYYSPRAYNYVRSKFCNNLPSITTLRNWYSSINAAPGFTSEAFDLIKKKAAEYKAAGKQLYVNLMFDEMSIRRHLQWNPHKMRYDGFIDIGRRVDGQDNVPLAKDALVFLISGATEDFKIPVSYFLINGLTAEEKAALLHEVLIRLNDAGVVVISITFDGLVTNLTMCKVLGANFENRNAYIINPANKDHKIYIIMDAPHMLKLIRNCLGTRNLIDNNNDVIEWRYIALLYEIQKNLSFGLGNKLTKSHMDWQSKKMSVKLAGETISKSVADSIEFLIGEDEQFGNAGPTVNFIRIFNDIFDVMNSAKESACGFKKPLSKTHFRESFDRFNEAMVYIEKIRVQGENKSIFASASYTPFIGFYSNMINFMNIFNDYVNTDKIDVLITHRFSQDLLESLFGCIRSMGGIHIFLNIL